MPLRAESLHKLLGTGGLPKLLKWWLYIEVWPFYGEVKFASLCICMGSIHLYGKNVENFKWLLLWSLWGQCCSNFKWRLLVVGEWKSTKIVTVHWPRWLPCPYGKNLKKSSSPELNKPWIRIFAQIIEMVVLCWCVTFLGQCQICFPKHLYRPYTFIMGKILRIHILDISSKDYDPIELKLVPSRHKIAKTEPIKNPRWPPQTPSWKSIFDVPSQTFGWFEPKLAL